VLSQGPGPGLARNEAEASVASRSAADTRGPGTETPSVSMAIQSPWRNRGVRLPLGSRTRWTEAVPGRLRRHSPNRRIFGLRSDRWAGNGTRRMLGSCQKTVLRGGAAKSPRPGCNSDCGADGRTVCRRCGRRKTLTIAARHIRRQEIARHLLDDIRSKIVAAQSVALPSSALSKACQYTLTLWKKLTRFLEYPELELSTNLAENSMRPVAIGRKNWLHIGSPQAGPKVAAILSIVESCRRLKLRVRDYLAAVPPGLPISRSSASHTLLQLRGSPYIHRLKRPGCGMPASWLVRDGDVGLENPTAIRHRAQRFPKC
jgi:hypothetical protein